MVTSGAPTIPARLGQRARPAAREATIVRHAPAPPAARPPRLLTGLQREDEQRSEEHTSELQSHSDLVCRLLLEKKNRQDTPFSGYRTGMCMVHRIDVINE